MTFWDTLDARYRLILCDIWGVVHDGLKLYPGAAERLRQWRGQGRCVVLITNAPRTADSVERQLAEIGLSRDCWDGISTSGEAGIAALTALGRPVGFLGTAEDRAILAANGVVFAADDDFTDLACTGLEERSLDTDRYIDRLDRWSERGVILHCLNPDRLVIRGGVAEACAGAIADLYEQMNGRVSWYGKPHRAIYDHALGLAGRPPAEAVLAIGDALRTDILGAARMGFDAVYVAGGIHAGEGFPPNFGRDHGLGEWRPVAVVDSLG